VYWTAFGDLYFIRSLVKSDHIYDRIYFGADDILTYFADLAIRQELPSVDALRSIARTLVRRYASQEAHEQALSLTESRNAKSNMAIPFGKPFRPIETQTPGLTTSTSETETARESTEERPNVVIEDTVKVHVEKEGFDGDRVLANEILFLQDAGWWIEAASAVPEGDIGRVYEIMKVKTSRTSLNWTDFRTSADMVIHLYRDIKPQLFLILTGNLLSDPVRILEGPVRCAVQQLACKFIGDGGSVDRGRPHARALQPLARRHGAEEGWTI
jgi:hypothetical protein